MIKNKRTKIFLALVFLFICFYSVSIFAKNLSGINKPEISVDTEINENNDLTNKCLRYQTCTNCSKTNCPYTKNCENCSKNCICGKQTRNTPCRRNQ